MALPMKSTRFYNFFPTKEEEINAERAGRTHVVTSQEIRMRELDGIQKVVETDEVARGILRLSWHDALNFLRYWPHDAASLMTIGHGIPVIIEDSGNYKRQYHGSSVYLQMSSNVDHSVYVCGMKDLVDDNYLKVGDVVCLTWDTFVDGRAKFLFKVISRSNGEPTNPIIIE